MPAPFPIINGTVSLENIANHLNLITDNLFWMAMMGSFFIIIFMIMKANTFSPNASSKAFTGASFISTVLSILLFMISFESSPGLVPIEMVIAFLIMTLLGVAFNIDR